MAALRDGAANIALCDLSAGLIAIMPMFAMVMQARPAPLASGAAR